MRYILFMIAIMFWIDYFYLGNGLGLIFGMLFLAGAFSLGRNENVV